VRPNRNLYRWVIEDYTHALAGEPAGVVTMGLNCCEEFAQDLFGRNQRSFESVRFISRVRPLITGAQIMLASKACQRKAASPLRCSVDVMVDLAAEVLWYPRPLLFRNHLAQAA
jgi:hypothetical protein